MWSFVRVRSMRCATSIAIAPEVGKSVRRDLEEHASSSIFYVMVGARSRATGSRTWLEGVRGTYTLFPIWRGGAYAAGHAPNSPRTPRTFR